MDISLFYLSCPHGLGLVRHPGLGHVSEGTPREDPRTPVGNTGHPSRCTTAVDALGTQLP